MACFTITGRKSRRFSSSISASLSMYSTSPVHHAHPMNCVFNMFDVNMVQRLAYERDFYELVTYLEEHRKEYVRFILTGEEE